MVTSPDNVTCFLCEHSFDGWTSGDHPIQEHLKHSPFCGWAVTAAVEANLGDYGKMHPLEPILVDARKATFGGKWPYESKRGFKCKSKQVSTPSHLPNFKGHKLTGRRLPKLVGSSHQQSRMRT